MALSINISSYLQSVSAPITGYPFSIVGWFRIQDVGEYVFLAGVRDTVSLARYELFFSGASDKKVVATTIVSPIVGAARSAIAMTGGQWHHVVGVFSADDNRKVILDGGNSGTDTTTLAFVAPNTFFVGSASSLTADFAEFALVDIAVSDEQAAMLAKGCPMLASPLSRNVVAYHDFIARTDRPGLGPSAPSVGTPGIVDHPPLLQAMGGWSNTVVSRIRGPMLVEQALYRSLSDEQGQLSVAGVASNNTVLSGEVVS